MLITGGAKKIPRSQPHVAWTVVYGPNFEFFSTFTIFRKQWVSGGDLGPRPL